MHTKDHETLSVVALKARDGNLHAPHMSQPLPALTLELQGAGEPKEAPPTCPHHHPHLHPEPNYIAHAKPSITNVA
jgi:hypothetical protein